VQFQQERIEKTDWVMIARLVGLSAAVCLCAYIAGRFSINRFLRWFLPPAIVLFILLPCLVLFEEYPGFIFFMSTLVSVFRFSFWIIFTVAVVECYASPRTGEGFWFFGLASVFCFSGVLSFLGPVINGIDGAQRRANEG